jgi:hypothetical protein
MTRPSLKTANFYRRMWALMAPDERWGFDVYFSRAEARRVRGAGERVVPVVVYTRAQGTLRTRERRP